MQRAFGLTMVGTTVLFFVCVFLLQSIATPMSTSCSRYYTLSPPSPSIAWLPAVPSYMPSYGTCAAVFPNASATMPSVGMANVQQQNMAQVACSGAPNSAYWVATINNDCDTPACFTSDGVACTPGAAGCPCVVVTACQQRVFTAPLACQLCPPTPCIVCPGAAPAAPAATVATAPANDTAPATTTTAAAAPAAANATVPAADTAAVLASPPPAAPAAGGRRSLRDDATANSTDATPTPTVNSSTPTADSSPPAPQSSPPANATSAAVLSNLTIMDFHPISVGGFGGGYQECVSPECLQCRKTSSAFHSAAGAIMLGFLIYAGYLRSRLHKEYGIEQSGGCCGEDSYLPWLCCWPFALCQEARTIDAMERDQQLVHGMHNPQAQPLMKTA